MPQAEGAGLSDDEEEEEDDRGAKKPAAKTKKRKKERGRARNPFIDDAAAEDDDEARTTGIYLGVPIHAAHAYRTSSYIESLRPWQAFHNNLLLL